MNDKRNNPTKYIRFELTSYHINRGDRAFGELTENQAYLEGFSWGAGFYTEIIENSQKISIELLVPAEHMANFCRFCDYFELNPKVICGHGMEIPYIVQYHRYILCNKNSRE